MGRPRVVVWFSAGAASAVAAKLALAEWGHDDVEIAYTDTGSEHPDNIRFIQDCEAWFGQPVHTLKSTKYEDTWEVWEKTRFLVGPTGARCTGELKKKIRFTFQRTDDIQVFGFTADTRDAARADRFREQNPEVDLRTPLIERGITKETCLQVLAEAGIELPAMYRMGYLNNNCVGCVKGGAGYWNKVREDFPDVFERMATLEERLGRSVLRRNGKPLPLRVLEPGTGRYPAEPDIECSLLCSATIHEIEAA